MTKLYCLKIWGGPLKLKCDVCLKKMNLVPKAYAREFTSLPVFCSAVCIYGYITSMNLVDPKASVQAIARVARLGKLKTVSHDYSAHSDILSMSFRSNFEKIFAEWLSVFHEHFLYEPFSFDLPGSVHEIVSYTPDFFLPHRNLFIETKGKWGYGQKTKVRKFLDLDLDTDYIIVPVRLQSEFERGA